MEKELRMHRKVELLDKPTFPHNIMIELTNKCNHKCVFCGYGKMQRKKNDADKEFTFNIIRQAYENGAREIGFYMIGEPLLAVDLHEFVAFAKELGYEYIYITTNGGLANIERMKQLIQAGVSSIKFSVNAGTRETYRLIHGRDDFLTVKSNITELYNYIQMNNLQIPVFISFVKTELNKNEINTLHKEFDGIVDRIYIFNCANQGGGMTELVANGIVKEENFLGGSSLPCEMVFNRIHVTCEGYLDACCADVEGYLAAVDLHKTTLLEAWNSDVMVNLRRKHLSGKLEGTLCYNCIYKKRDKVIPLNIELVNMEGRD